MTLRATATFKPANMAGLLAKVAAGLYAGVAEAAALVEGEAKTLCPVGETGDLQRSIDTVITRGINAVTGSDAALSTGLYTVSARIEPHMPYAAYVEFGTGRRGGASEGAGAGPYMFDWEGMVAQPYMRPALDGQRENVIAIVQAAVADAVKSGTVPLAA
jgi:HK97 gp10 family phage protein